MQMLMQPHSVLVRFFREEGFNGWVAHVLHLDVVTKGDSLNHAIEMAEEAAGIVLAEDLSRGLDPLDRAARPEDWHEAYDRVLQGGSGRRVQLSEVIEREDEFREVLVRLFVSPCLMDEDEDDGPNDSGPRYQHEPEVDMVA